MPKINKFRELYKIVDKFIVLYSGNIGAKQGLEVVLEVAKQTEDNKNIIYVIVGDGARRDELVYKYEKLGLQNMIFLPLQPKEIFPHVLAAADILLVPQQKKTKDVFMPSKLLGIMASGRAVIAGASVGTELYTVLEDSGCGLIVEPENPGQLLEAIMKLYNDPQKAEDYGKKAREFVVNHFSRVSILKTFEDAVDIKRGS
jgi:colanic acid biosynthesis glycosyl transferase WcaI